MINVLIVVLRAIVAVSNAMIAVLELIPIDEPGNVAKGGGTTPRLLTSITLMHFSFQIF
ncbi:hypothetical protein G4Y60_21935 [Salmonella enterica subsp. enterica]|nr:hypothetical protein [Salmonella enterica subsp. enterica]NEX73021.1 hypothetical protein [Salmonella enterica subsp. enterica]